MKRGTQIVLTAPFTEMIDHAGYFIQMGMASIPIWMEWVMDRKYPAWRNVKRFEDGSAQAAPAGLRVLERVMANEFGREAVVVWLKMLKKEKVEKVHAVTIHDTHKILEKISKQLERLILCQEKKLSGEVFKNFNSQKEVDNA